MANITISDDRIRNFVEAYRKEYFEDHSMEWCLAQHSYTTSDRHPYYSIGAKKLQAK